MWVSRVCVPCFNSFPLTSKEEEEEDSSPGVSFSLSSEESEMEPEEERIRYSQRLVSIGPKLSRSALGSDETEGKKRLSLTTGLKNPGRVSRWMAAACPVVLAQLAQG